MTQPQLPRLEPGGATPTAPLLVEGSSESPTPRPQGRILLNWLLLTVLVWVEIQPSAFAPGLQVQVAGQVFSPSVPPGT